MKASIGTEGCSYLPMLEKTESVEMCIGTGEVLILRCQKSLNPYIFASEHGKPLIFRCPKGSRTSDFLFFLSIDSLGGNRFL